jgi:hypothetical protein
VNYIKKTFNFLLKHKIIIGVNYHRVGNSDLNDPFGSLHTVNFRLFKFQILLLNLFFKIVSLNDIRNGNIKSKINFFISFDVVTTISKQAFQWLEKKEIPFVICPNIKLVEEFSSIRDRFKFTLQKVKKEEIEKKLHNFLNTKQMLILKIGGLKKLYKSYTIDQRKLENLFEENIFKDLEYDFFKYFKKSNYLSWEDIKNISKRNSLASHGYNHYDFFFLDYQEILNELELSKNIFEDKIKSKIATFAIPYGGYNQHLAILVSEIAKKIGYDQVLWTGTQGVIYNNRNNNQVQHLFRINTPGNFVSFIKSIILALKNTKSIFKENQSLTTVYDRNNYNFEIVENPSISKIIAFENIIRPYRKYSTDKNFIKNIYVNNPFRDELPYAFSLSRNTVVNSISYHLYKNYIINKKTFKIVEHSGWRKINSLNTTENVKLYLLVSKTCKAFYHWRPSDFVKPGLLRSEHYFKFPIKEYSFKIRNYKIGNSFDLKKFDKCPNTIDNFLDSFNKKFYLTLERSTIFYKWRIDNYPIGRQQYFVKKKNNKVSSLLVSQIYKNKAMIVDLIGNDFDESILMIQNFINYCKINKIINIKFAISNIELIKKIDKVFDYEYSSFESFIYIKNLVNENLLDKEVLKKKETFETYASGDVLIR